MSDEPEAEPDAVVGDTVHFVTAYDEDTTMARVVGLSGWVEVDGKCYPVTFQMTSEEVSFEGDADEPRSEAEADPTEDPERQSRQATPE